MSTHLRYMTFSRNNDTLMAPIDISMIDDIIKNAIATGILTNSTQIQTNGILSLIVVYPKVTRGIQRLS